MPTARPPLLSRVLTLRSGAVATCVAVLGGALVATASADAPAEAPLLVAAAEAGRSALPVGSSDRTREGLERTAVHLAAVLDAVPLREAEPDDADDPARFCPEDRLRVQWSAPGDGFAVGGHVDPVGPAPTAGTDAVNGIVVCEGAGYAYMGFEARSDGGSWDVAAVPALSDEHELHEEGAEEEPHAEEHEHEEEATAAPAPVAAPPVPQPPPARPAPSGSLTGLAALSVGGIDPYARYDPQRTCDPVGKPGAVGLRDLLLSSYPVSRSLGVSRTCTARGVSEHKEGRAFDWGVNLGVPAQRAAAESAISQLMATDAAGNRHALARRLGVMYVIWNRQIWSAYNPDGGWRPYSGASPHTDHVHLSLSWDGAMGRTSFWRGEAASLLRFEPGLQLAPMPSSGGASGGGSGGAVSGGGSGDAAKPAKRRKAPEGVPAVPVARKQDGAREEDLGHGRRKAGKGTARREDERTGASGEELAGLPVDPTEAPRPPGAPKPPKAERPDRRPAEVRAPERPKAERPRAERPKAERAPRAERPKPVKAEHAPRAERRAERPKPVKAERAKARTPEAAKPPQAPEGGKGGGGKGKR